MPVRVHATGSSFDEFTDEVWDMMREVTSRNFFRSHAPHAWTPRLNMYETADRYLVCVELAGMAAERIDIRGIDGVLHVRGVREKPDVDGALSASTDAAPEGAAKHDQLGVHVMEIDSGRFHLKIPIPGDVVADRMTARYRAGYLWIDLPRTKPATPGERDDG